MTMKILTLVTLFFMGQVAFAGFGGSRGGGGGFSGSRSSFSGSRSYSSGSYSRSSSFGGSRASSGRVTYSKPSAPASRAPSTPAPAPTVIHNYGTQGYSGPGFFTGLLLGNMMNHGGGTVVAPQGEYVESGGGFGVFTAFILLVLIGGAVYVYARVL